MTVLLRRSFLIGSVGGLGALLLPRSPAFADVQAPLQPGDFGYKHDMYHLFYQMVFKDHCSCGEGDCRVTDWRETKLGSPKGYDVIAYRKWMPLPGTVYIPPPHLVPKELRTERAHICAYYEDNTQIPCAIINDTQT